MATRFFAEKPCGNWMTVSETSLFAIVTEKLICFLYKGMLKGRDSRTKVPDPVEGDEGSCLQVY